MQAIDGVEPAAFDELFVNSQWSKRPDNAPVKPLKSLFVERFADTPLKIISNENKGPPADDPEGLLSLDKFASGLSSSRV
jgi:hypothetical protein|tara:strand:- start:247 stop:486 length:240 start_codon:yes stop_codon:yes gene_type:complete